jgi:hypothetical protein
MRYRYLQVLRRRCFQAWSSFSHPVSHRARSQQHLRMDKVSNTSACIQQFRSKKYSKSLHAAKCSFLAMTYPCFMSQLFRNWLRELMYPFPSGVQFFINNVASNEKLSCKIRVAEFVYILFVRKLFQKITVTVRKIPFFQTI